MQYYSEENLNEIISDEREERTNLNQVVVASRLKTMCESGSSSLTPAPIKQKFISKHSFKVKLQYKKKDFVKKILFAQSVGLPKEIFMRQNSMIFGFIELEDHYDDFEDPFDQKLRSLSAKLISVNSVIRKFISNEIHVEVSANGPSGISDFSALVQHFNRYSQYFIQEKFHSEHANLGYWLTQYQEIVKDHFQHLKELKSMIHSSSNNQLSLADCENAKIAFIQYIEEYFKKNYSEDDCYAYNMYSTNFQLFDIQPIKYVLSQAFFNIYGIPIENYEQILLHPKQDYKNQRGYERIKLIIRIIKEIVTSFSSEPEEIDFKTFDDISIKAMCHSRIIYWEDRPAWATKLDFLCVVNVYEVSAKSLEKLIHIRGQDTSSTQISLVYENLAFEQLMQAEIFVDKFYSNLTSPQTSNQIQIE